MGKKTKRPSMPEPAAAIVGTDDDIADQLFAALDQKEAVDEPAPMPAPAPTEVSPESEMPRVSRQKARIMRRDQEMEAMRQRAEEELIANGGNIDEAGAEAADLAQQCASLAVVIHEVTPDGHCLYAAIADQLNVRRPMPQQYTYQDLRTAASRYMRAHADDFMPFISDLEEESAGIESESSNAQAKYERYCDAIENTAVWGGQPEILALSHVFSTPIHIVQRGMPVICIGEDYKDNEPLFVSYHHKMYGLGEHYNSLRPRPADSK